VEQGFISALTRFNYRRLEKQRTKLSKGKGKTLRKGTPERGFKKSKQKPLSADISVKDLASLLGIDSENVSTLLSSLKEAVNNKDVEKYTCLFTECSNTAYTLTDSENKRKGKTIITKKQIKTKKRHERRKLPTTSLTKNKDRFIKNLSKTNLTDSQRKLLTTRIEIYSNSHSHEK